MGEAGGETAVRGKEENGFVGDGGGCAVTE